MDRKPGFTLNLSHYFLYKRSPYGKRWIIIDGDYIRTRGEKKILQYIESNYSLGFVFGSFLAIGNTNVAVYDNKVRGAVNWYIPATKTEEFETLEKCLYESFRLNISLMPKSKNSYRAICYSKPVAMMFMEFGKGSDRHLPPQYFVSNRQFLSGLKDGIGAFDGHLIPGKGSQRKFSTQVQDLYYTIQEELDE